MMHKVRSSVVLMNTGVMFYTLYFWYKLVVFRDPLRHHPHPGKELLRCLPKNILHIAHKLVHISLAPSFLDYVLVIIVA